MKGHVLSVSLETCGPDWAKRLQFARTRQCPLPGKRPLETKIAKGYFKGPETNKRTKRDPMYAMSTTPAVALGGRAEDTQGH